jgi:hypothetical protein
VVCESPSGGAPRGEARGRSSIDCASWIRLKFQTPAAVASDPRGFRATGPLATRFADAPCSTRYPHQDRSTPASPTSCPAAAVSSSSAGRFARRSRSVPSTPRALLFRLGSAYARRPQGPRCAAIRPPRRTELAMPPRSDPLGPLSSAAVDRSQPLPPSLSPGVRIARMCRARSPPGATHPNGAGAGSGAPSLYRGRAPFPRQRFSASAPMHTLFQPRPHALSTAARPPLTRRRWLDSPPPVSVPRRNNAQRWVAPWVE